MTTTDANNLRPIYEDVQAQIAQFESGQFKVVAVACQSTPESDCTLDHLAVLRSLLAELESHLQSP